MGPLEVLIILVAWIAPVIAVAKYAERRGLDFWLCLIFGLLASWVVALLVAQFKGSSEPSPPSPAERVDDSGGAVS